MSEVDDEMDLIEGDPGKTVYVLYEQEGTNRMMVSRDILPSVLFCDFVLL